MTAFLTWALVASGLAVVVVRRRSIVVAIVTAQALVLAVAALVDASSRDDLLAGAALAVRAVLLALLVAGWTILPGAHWFWTATVLTVMASQLLPLIPRMIAGPRKAQSFPVFWRDLWADTAIALAQIILGVTFLAYHAWDTAHAIVLTLIRLTITKRRLLEWETAASAAAQADRRGRGSVRKRAGLRAVPGGRWIGEAAGRARALPARERS